MKQILFILLAIFTLGSCDKDDNGGSNSIAITGGEQIQNVYADNTSGSGVNFTTTAAWTSTIQETTPDTKADAPAPKASWVSINPASGDKAGNYSINITLSANFTGKDRTATININCNGKSVPITVKQKAKTEAGEIPSEEIGVGSFTNTKGQTVSIAKATHEIASKNAVRLEFYKDKATSADFSVDMYSPLSNGRLAAGTYKHGESNGGFEWSKSELGGYSSGGTITVAVSGDTYTISLDIDADSKESSDKITGIYTGKLVYLNEEIKVAEITLDKSEMTLEIGKSAIISATILPENALNKDFKWSSNKPEIATVSEDGYIKALSAGTAIITATTVDGNKTASCTVTVKPFEGTGTGSFTNTKTNQTVNIAKATHNISSKDMVILGFYKDKATYGSFSVEMYNPLSNGRLAAGTYRHGESNGGFEWSKSELGGYSSGGTITVAVSGDTYTITLDIDTEGEESEKITGTYTGKLEYLNEEIKVTGITFDKNILNLEIGESGVLNATVLPENALNKSFTWKTSNPNVASVSEHGNIQALAVGTTTITATTEDGNKIASCNITVKALENTGSGKFTYTYNNASLNVTGAVASVGSSDASLAFHQDGTIYSGFSFYFNNTMTNGKLTTGTYTFAEKGGPGTFYLDKGAIGKDNFYSVGGTVTVSASGETYTITLNVDTVTGYGSEGSNSAKITGTYTGKIQYK